MIAFLVGAAVPAQAQIYSWRDANGNLVLSNKRADGTSADLPSYAVPSAEGVRTTRSVLAERARPYESLITEHSRAQGVRPALVRAVMQVESGFNPYAQSPKGAMGLMQLMPATAKQFGVRNAFNPTENVRAGVAYLRELLDRYQDNEELALAAYNAGPGAVDKHGQTVPPYRETQSYVAQINKMAAKPAVTNSGTTIYKAMDVTPDGRPIPLYTDKKPER
jgi:soluble lytic murein transglycosylase-like protein